MLSTCEIYIRDFRSSLEIPSLMLKQFLPRITDHLPRIENVRTFNKLLVIVLDEFKL